MNRNHLGKRPPFLARFANHMNPVKPRSIVYHKQNICPPPFYPLNELASTQPSAVRCPLVQSEKNGRTGVE